MTTLRLNSAKGRKLVKLARTFRTSYREWKRLTPKDRAAVSFLARLYLGRIGR